MFDSLCRVHINWARFRHNTALLQSEGGTLLPVIKADAYGHGVVRAAAELEAMGLEWAAAGTPEEGVLIRNAGFGGHIVSLLTPPLSAKIAALMAEHRILPVCYNQKMLRFLAERGQAMEIVVKVDTGMCRLGIPQREWAESTEFLAAHPFLRPVLLLSHLSVADEPDKDAFTREQARLFQEAEAIFRAKFPHIHTSLGNSAGLLAHRKLSAEICRPGLALYGYDPLAGTVYETKMDFLPVMDVTAPLVSIHPLHKGAKLGYGCAYVAESERMVGWVGIGYADGYRRTSDSRACMCLKGRRVPIIGRIAMQMTCVDLTDFFSTNTAQEGDDVYVLGGPGDAVTAWDIASWWNTIPYEVTLELGRNPREDV